MNIKPAFLLLALTACTTQTPDKLYVVDIAASQQQFDNALKRQPLKPVLKKSLQHIIGMCHKPELSDVKQFGREYWQTPNEYQRNGKGDCDDFAMCAYYQLNQHYQTKIITGTVGKVGHVLIEVDNKYVLDNNTQYPWKIKDYYKKIDLQFKQEISK